MKLQLEQSSREEDAPAVCEQFCGFVGRSRSDQMRTQLRTDSSVEKAPSDFLVPRWSTRFCG